MTHHGDIFIRTEEDAEKHAGLSTVNGELHIFRPFNLDAPFW